MNLKAGNIFFGLGRLALLSNNKLRCPPTLLSLVDSGVGVFIAPDIFWQGIS